MDDHAFLWPDEDPPARDVRARARDLVSELAGRTRPAAPAARPRWRFTHFVRTRPLPLALGLAVGLGPLAWAVRGLDTLPAAPAATLPAGSADGAARSGHAPGPSASQWGEPLPQFRHLFDPARAARSGAALPPSTTHRSSGSVVLASEYYAARRARDAAGDSALAAAGPAPEPALPESRAATPVTTVAVPSPAAAPVAQAAPPGAQAAPASPLAELAELLWIPAVVALDDQAASQAPGSAAWTLPEAVARGLQRSAAVQSAKVRVEAFRALAAPGAARGWLDDATPSAATSPGAADREQALAAAAEIVWRSAAAEVAGQVAAAYLQSLQAALSLSLALEHERELRHLVALGAARGARDEAGRAEQGLLRLQAARARARVSDARVVHDAAREHLSALTGVRPQGLVLDLPGAWYAPVDLRGAIDDATHRNLALQAARSEVTALAVAAWRAAAGTASTPARAADVAGTARPGPRGAGPSPAAGPFDDGGPLLRLGDARAARAPTPLAREDDVQRRIDRELRSAYAALQALQSRAAPLRRSLDRQRLQVAHARTRLVKERGPATELVDAYALQHARRMELAAVMFDEAAQHLRIAQLTGRLPGSERTLVAAR